MRLIGIAAAVCVAAVSGLVTACTTDAGGTATAQAPTSTARDAPADAAECAETQDWATKETQADPVSTDALHQVRAGKHDCYDRVVLDIDGPADVGYLVGYVPVVTSDGSGAPVPVDGDAALQVIVRAPAQDASKNGDYFYTADQLAGWSSLRAVRFAGSFEGQSTLALGVRQKLPFRVFTQLEEKDKTQRLVIDIAHERP